MVFEGLHSVSFLKSKPKGGFKVTLGPIQNQLFKKEILTEAELNHHVHVVGATGFGKSVFFNKITKELTKQSQGFLYLDLKGDLETKKSFLETARSVGRESSFQFFSISDAKNSNNYNPLANGNATQLRDRIMLSFNWSEEFYKSQSASYLLKILLVLVYLRDHQNQPIDFQKLYLAISDSDFLSEITQQVPESESQLKNFAIECYQFLREKDSFKSLQGLRSQVESLIYSDFGHLLKHQEFGINFFESINQNKTIIIFLDSRSYPESSIVLGRLILQDLKSTSAKIDANIPKSDRIPFNVIIDEFSDFAQEDFIGFLDRARSSKISILVAHQELCDLNRISPEFAGRLMGNMTAMYVFLQKRPESAEILAKTAGTKLVLKKTEATEKFLFFDFPTGKKSLREVEEFNIHPNEIKSLRVGECIAIKKYPYSRAHKVKISI